jgi:thiol-disulfide isomerase/thioredoxin
MTTVYVENIVTTIQCLSGMLAIYICLGIRNGVIGRLRHRIVNKCSLIRIVDPDTHYRPHPLEICSSVLFGTLSTILTRSRSTPPKMATLQEITTDDAFNSFIQSAPPTSLIVLYFHAPWAAPCTQMQSILTALASTYPSNDSISFLSINAEELSDTSENYNVTAVPFLVLQRGGKTLETVSGSDATKVRSAVERHAGVSGAGKTGIPPPLQATPQTNGTSQPPPQTAPADSSAETDKEELNARLAKLVKAAPVRGPVVFRTPLLISL